MPGRFIRQQCGSTGTASIGSPNLTPWPPGSTRSSAASSKRLQSAEPPNAVLSPRSNPDAIHGSLGEIGSLPKTDRRSARQDARASAICRTRGSQRLRILDQGGQRPSIGAFWRQEYLFVIHNMGAGCRNCTLWADGFNGMLRHIENRAATRSEEHTSELQSPCNL